MSIATSCLGVVDAMHRTYERVDRRGFDARCYDENERDLIAMSLAMCSPEVTDTSRLLWIAPEMVDLVMHASETLTPYVFHAAALPWPSAVVVCAKPTLTVVDRWDGESQRISTFQWCADRWRTADGAPFCMLTGLHWYKGELSPVLTATIQEGSEWEDVRGSVGDASERGREYLSDVSRFICALWLLVQQKVAVGRKATPSRADVRRWMRISHAPIPETTIIELRKPAGAERERTEPGFVDWSHRWIVDGHWRNQYHPSTGEHVPTWIAPYVKGPEDKPLVVQRKISAWVR